MQELGANSLPSRPLGNYATGQGIIKAIIFPDARIMDIVRERLTRLRYWNNGRVTNFLPIEQQRVLRYGHHRSSGYTVVDGNDPIAFNQS